MVALGQAGAARPGKLAVEPKLLGGCDRLRCEQAHAPIAVCLAAAAVKDLKISPLNDELGVFAARHDPADLAHHPRPEKDRVQLVNRGSSSQGEILALDVDARFQEIRCVARPDTGFLVFGAQEPTYANKILR